MATAVAQETVLSVLCSSSGFLESLVLQDPSLAEKECVICAESFADTLDSKFHHRLWFTEESSMEACHACGSTARMWAHISWCLCQEPQEKKHGAYTPEW